jgi:hypothetical protein
MGRKELLAAMPGLEPGYLSTERQPGPPPRCGGLEESRDARRTRLNNEQLAQGRHPATRAALLDPAWGYHCGDCTHAFRVSLSTKQVWKCELHRLGPSHSEASDIRVGWPACTRFKLG